MSYFGKKIIQDYLSTNRLSRRGKLKSDIYDEPVYIGFKLEFVFNDIGWEWSNNKLPHGLLLKNTYIGNAEEYLMNLNQGRRAAMLKEFKTRLEEIQNNYQWVYTEVSGLDSIYKIDATNSYRGADKTITIKFNESLDTKMAYILDLYRKIAFDAVNMKWILPDIMRFFKMNIYVSEIRSFHQPLNQDVLNGTDPITGSLPNKFGSQFQEYGAQIVDKWDKANEKVRNLNVLPDKAANLVQSAHFLEYLDANISIMKFEFSQCEFDINSFTMSSLETLTTNPTEGGTGSFSVKVGHIRESNMWSLWDMLLSDENVNSSSNTLPIIDSGTKMDLLNSIGGEHGNPDAAYGFEPYIKDGVRHLGDSANVGSSITENLLSDLENIALSRSTDFVTESVTKPLIGNVYGLSLSETAGLLQGGLSGAITAVNQLYNNSSTSNAGENILQDASASFDDSYQSTPKADFTKNLELTSEGQPLGSVKDTNFKETATDTSDNNLGNIGFTDIPSSSK